MEKKLALNKVILIILVATIYSYSANADFNDINLSSAFEMGNLINVNFTCGNSSGYREYSGEINYSLDVQEDKHWWFYFNANNITNKTIVITIKNIPNIDVPRWSNVQPVYSYDNENWNRLNQNNFNFNRENREYNITISQERYSDVYIAALYPYTNAKLDRLFISINESNYTKIEDIGYSPEGRPIRMLTINDQEVNDSNKKKIFIISGQHNSGEVQGVYSSEGMIKFLLNETNDLSNSIRKNYTFKIVPIVNVDATAIGRSRYNINWIDLNREWGNYPAEQEVNIVREHVIDFNPDLFLDFHGSIGSDANYWFNGINNDRKTNNLMGNISKYWTNEGSEGVTAVGSAAREIYEDYGVLSVLIEWAPNKAERNGEIMTQNDWIKDGEEIIFGINDYFNSNKENDEIPEDDQDEIIEPEQPAEPQRPNGGGGSGGGGGGSLGGGSSSSRKNVIAQEDKVKDSKKDIEIVKEKPQEDKKEEIIPEKIGFFKKLWNTLTRDNAITGQAVDNSDNFFKEKIKSILKFLRDLF